MNEEKIWRGWCRDVSEAILDTCRQLVIAGKAPKPNFKEVGRGPAFLRFPTKTVVAHSCVFARVGILNLISLSGSRARVAATRRKARTKFSRIRFAITKLQSPSKPTRHRPESSTQCPHSSVCFTPCGADFRCYRRWQELRGCPDFSGP